MTQEHPRTYFVESDAQRSQSTETSATRVDSSVAIDKRPPPDAGITAWLQVLAGHLVLFNAWGYVNSFGIFQGPYAQALALPAATVSWIGSVQVFLIFFLGSLSGRALDAGYYSTVLWLGTLLELVGVFMTSLSNSYWQIFLAQGLCQGIGCGLFFGPTMALVSTYFSKKRTVAISVVASGAATGGVVFPIMSRKLLPMLGLHWTTRIMGFVILFNSVVIIACARSRLPPRKLGPLIELSAFKELPYLLFAMGSFFTFWGTYYSYYYARLFAIDVLHADESTSFVILVIMNAVGVPGRVLLAAFADYFEIGPIFVLAPCVFIAGLLLFLWATVHHLAEDFVWVVFFGWFSASIQGLFPATCASLVPDLDRRGTRIGMIFSIVAVACLTGPPLAGSLLQRAGGAYIGAQVWGGVSLTVGSAIYVGAGMALRRQRKESSDREKV